MNIHKHEANRVLFELNTVGGLSVVKLVPSKVRPYRIRQLFLDPKETQELLTYLQENLRPITKKELDTDRPDGS